jgi:acetate kinase
MLVLVANLGSTASSSSSSTWSGTATSSRAAGYERIGQKDAPYRTHGDVIDVILKEIGPQARRIGFKAVHGGPISGAVRVTDDVIATMEQFADVAPAPQPARTSRRCGRFEKSCPRRHRWRHSRRRFTRRSTRATGLRDPATSGRKSSASGGTASTAHRTATSRRACRAGRQGKEPADHLVPPRRVVFDLRDRSRKERREQFWMTAQSGVPHNNRVGDFDTFALMKLTKQGLASTRFSRSSAGKAACSDERISPDMRDIEAAAAKGDRRAQLALDAFVEASAASSDSTWSRWAAAMCSPSPAASARTASPSARPSAATWRGPASVSTRTRTRCAARKKNQQRRIGHGNLDRPDQRRTHRSSTNSISSERELRNASWQMAYNK